MRLLAILIGVLVLSLRPLPAHAQATFVILARHAEKAAPTGDAELTPVGEQRARDLADALARVRLAAVITTQYRRTQLTAAPTARASHLDPIVIPATGDMDSDAAAVTKALDALPSGSAALVVGHSNTLGPIIAALGGPWVPDLCDNEYSTLLILERAGGSAGVSLVRSRYGAAESLEASHCR